MAAVMMLLRRELRRRRRRRLGRVEGGHGDRCMDRRARRESVREASARESARCLSSQICCEASRGVKRCPDGSCRGRMVMEATRDRNREDPGRGASGGLEARGVGGGELDSRWGGYERSKGLQALSEYPSRGTQGATVLKGALEQLKDVLAALRL